MAKGRKQMEQLSLFQTMYEDFKLNKPIRLIECFGGIGAQSKALEILGADFAHYKLVEWAVPSIKAYNSIHIKDFKNYAENLTKEELIQKVNGISLDYNMPLSVEQLNKKPIQWLADVYNNMVATNDLCPDVSRLKGQDLEIENEENREHQYILTYSFPCQDLSNAGQRAGYQKGSNTRSGLLWEIERIIQELKVLNQRPDALVMENVQGVFTDIESWNSWLDSLTELGYTNYYKKINAKDYGIPQNRVRVFMVSILGNYSYIFPRKIKLKYRLKDFLDKGEVDEKYYLSDKMKQYIVAENDKYLGNNENCVVNKENASTITTREGNTRADASSYVCDELEENTNIKELSNLFENGCKGVNRRTGVVFDEKGISPTLLARNQGDNGFVAIKNATKQGYLLAEDGDGIDISGRMESHRGTVQKGLTQTITTMGGNDIGVLVDEQKTNSNIKEK